MIRRFLQRFDERLPSLEAYKAVQRTLKTLKGVKKVKAVAVTLLSTFIWSARGLGALMLWALILVFSVVPASPLLLEGVALGDSDQRAVVSEERIHP